MCFMTFLWIQEDLKKNSKDLQRLLTLLEMTLNTILEKQIFF